MQVRLIIQDLAHSQWVIYNFLSRTSLDDLLFWGGPESVAGWMDGSRAVWRCVKARELSTSTLLSPARRSWRGAHCCIYVSERRFDSPGDSLSWFIASCFTLRLFLSTRSQRHDNPVPRPWVSSTPSTVERVSFAVRNSRLSRARYQC